MVQFLLKYFGHGPVRCFATRAALKVTRNAKNAETTLPYISCRRKEFNLLVPTSDHGNAKFGTIPLASKGWMHYKAKTDQFTINPILSEEEMQLEMQPVMEFLKTLPFEFDPQILENLKNEMGVTHLTNIQSKGIPSIYDNHHLLMAAETGCGKTLAYLLPIVQKVHELKISKNLRIKERKLNTPLALVITPGRELATQVAGVVEKLTKSMNVNVKTILGGNTKRLMMNPDFEEVDVLVATIGALSKLVTTGIYRMSEVRHVVLDESDCLLDDSFSDKLCHFLKRFPFHKNRMVDEHSVGTQLILASATMPTNINERLERIIDVDTLREVVSPRLHRIMPHVEQRFIRMGKSNRPVNLLSIVKTEVAKKRPVIVFSNKSATSDFVSIFLNNSGVNCLNLNGDMLMKIRLGRFEQFQNGECDVLSTTDVGSRGLDTMRARHVINFDFPLHISEYIHRCGRIGRVSSLQKCLVTNFVSSRREVPIVQQIEHTARTGGILPDVNANIKGIINRRIVDEMKNSGLSVQEEEEEAF